MLNNSTTESINQLIETFSIVKVILYHVLVKLLLSVVFDSSRLSLNRIYAAKLSMSES